MRLHRFYVGGVHDKWGPLELTHEVWVHDARLLNQWLKVLRYRQNDQLVLFNDETERIYKIIKIEQPHSVGLELVTETERTVPSKHLYLLWSLLKKDKNDWVLQKATELGVRNFVPILAARSEKTGFDIERAKKIIIEAAEQCGRSDIPDVREPITIEEAVKEYAELPLFVCEQSTEKLSLDMGIQKIGVLVGPEGGWAETELEMFKEYKLQHIAIAQFTLRAETAAVTVAGKLLQ
jgi:16S rRNA (uracil1498-N3)-methyltransferase